MRTARVVVGPALAALGSLVLFLVLYRTPALDPRLAAPAVHFWLVSATALLASGLAIAVAWTGVRARDGRVVYLGAGLVGLAGFFALHGLATPGFIVAPGTVVGIASQLSVLSLAAWMAAAAYRRPRDEGRGLARLLVGWTLTVAAVVVLGLIRPELFRFVPIDDNPLRWLVTTVIVALLAASGARFVEGYRLSRSGLHLVMVYVVGLLAVTQLIMVVGELFQLSWWLYHLVLLGAVIAMLVTIARQLQAGSLDRGLRALLDDDAEQRLAYGLRPEVRALIVATEAKDPYTAGHMQRVANYAVRLGVSVGLDADELRALAQAGVIHDVGKIEVPDAILNKPARLTEEEYAKVKTHAAVGERIASELGMYPRELQVIRHHHERWDGRGYPDGLANDEIPRLARVLSVVDVFDAMTSDRSYRRPLSHDEALAHIEQGEGRAFDPALAAAWVRLMRTAT